MNAYDLTWLWPLTHLGTALVFLLVGWRFGREASGRPMFAFPLLPPSQAPAGEEADPWAEAAAGRSSVAGDVDKNVTVDWP